MNQPRVKKNETTKIVIIADDFTGALDTGIQFTKRGARCLTLTNVETWKAELLLADCDVLVIDAETRHLSAADAYKVVYQIVESCRQMGDFLIYKKTDSALRGNIGAEIKAAMDAAEVKEIPFVPAYPQIGRCTVEGIHYVNSIPVADSVLGKDPFEPVKSSRVADLFKEEDIPVCDKMKVSGDIPVPEAGTVLIYDCKSVEELDKIAEKLICQTGMMVLAGCAGFAEAIAKLFSFKQINATEKMHSTSLLVLCGSMSEISREQIEFEENRGTARISLNRLQKSNIHYLETEEGSEWLDKLLEEFKNEKLLIVDTETGEGIVEEGDRIEKELLRVEIADMLGKIGSYIVTNSKEATIMVIGGDTLLGFLKHMKCCRIEPVEEIETGTVLSKIVDGKKQMWMISKSGGFGERTLVANVIDKLGRG